MALFDHVLEDERPDVVLVQRRDDHHLHWSGRLAAFYRHPSATSKPACEPATPRNRSPKRPTAVSFRASPPGTSRGDSPQPPRPCSARAFPATGSGDRNPVVGP